MQTTHADGCHEPIAPVVEDGVTINYWPIRTTERVDSFEVPVLVQVGGQRVRWTMRMREGDQC